MTALGLALGLLIGLSLGLLGGGGSILTVPIFVYILGYAPKAAIAMTLPVVGTTSLVGAVGHWRAGNVQLRQALVFGLFAMGGAYAGARAATLLSGVVQLLILAFVMLAAAISMLRAPERRPAEGGETRARWLMPLVGVGVGVLTGLVGIGGGFLIVPALVLFARLPMTQAVGTSLVVIALNAVAGFAGYVEVVEIPWTFLGMFTAVAIVGILAGTHFVRFVSQRTLKRAFGVFLLFVAAFILFQNRSALAL